MIPPIEVNTDDIRSQFDVSQTQVDEILDGISKSLALVYVSKLEQNAFSVLNSTKNSYLQAIRLIDSGKMQSTVLLDYSNNKLVKMIEEGYPPFDMKKALLTSTKVKLSKNNKPYITVPIQHKTADMPKKLYDTVRTKLSGESVSKSELPEALQKTGKRMSIVNRGKTIFDEYQHKSSEFEGLTNVKDSVTGQSAYFTFRRVSDNSDSVAFIHPGFVAANLMKRTYDEMDLPTEVGTLMDKELSKLGF